MAQMNLDLSGVSVLNGKTVLPTGIYNVKTSSAEIKETSTKGWMIEVSMTVIDGEHAGKTVMERLNVVNANETAQKIGLSTAKTMLTVGGAANPNALTDSNELIGLSMSISVEEKDSEYKDKVTGEAKKGKEQKFLGYFKLQAPQVAPVVATPAVAVVAAPVAAPLPSPVVATPAVAVVAAPVAFPWAK